MKREDVLELFDIHELLDRLEQVGNTREYYQVNHSSPKEREELREHLTQAMEVWCNAAGIKLT